MREPPKLESIIVGHINGGNGLRRRIVSSMAIITGVKLAISAVGMREMNEASLYPEDQKNRDCCYHQS